MLQPTRYTVLAVVGASLVAGFVLHRWTGRPARIALAELQQRVQALAAEADAARAAPVASGTYAPRVAGNITELPAPTAAILRQLPGAAQVETLVACDRPTHRIIHLRDWHLVARDDYLRAVQAASGQPINDGEADLLMQELRLQVELVQAEQLRALRCLVERHGLNQVLSENASAQGIADFRAHLAELRTADADLARLAKSRAELKGHAADFDRELAALRHQHFQDLLAVGAAGRIAVEGLADVLPLEDDRVFEADYPFRPDGSFDMDPTKLRPRHDAQVRAALASGPVTVIVLGASHDLSESVHRLGDGSTEYIQVTMKAVERFARRD
jgi:hypothetical protein